MTCFVVKIARSSIWLDTKCIKLLRYSMVRSVGPSVVRIRSSVDPNLVRKAIDYLVRRYLYRQSGLISGFPFVVGGKINDYQLKSRHTFTALGAFALRKFPNSSLPILDEFTSLWRKKTLSSPKLR